MNSDYRTMRDIELESIRKTQQETLRQHKNDFSNVDGLSEAWSCDCGKCFHRFICKDKHNGFYCKSYFNSEDHDKQVRANAIDKFAEKLSEWCCDEAYMTTINGVPKVEILTIDGLTEMIFDLAERLKGENKC